MFFRRAMLVLLRGMVREFVSGGTGFLAPASRRLRTFAIALEIGFRFSVVLSAFLLIGVATIRTSSPWLNWTKLGLGVILLIEGTLLATNAGGARRLLLWRLMRKSPGAAHLSIRGQLFRWAAPSAVSLLGLAWLAAGLATGAFALQTLL